MANAASDYGVKLASVEALQPGAGSGVYLVETVSRVAGVHKKARKAMNPLLEQVTLVVYGWQNVEPGTLSWVFPSVGAAVAAARAMKNAVKWAIVAGKREEDGELVVPDGAAQQAALDEARANGTVLVEQGG